MVLHGDDFDLDEVKAMADTTGIPVTVDQCPSTTTYGDCLNTAIDLATGDIVTKMDDDDYYGPNHINDLTTALHYSQADIVGKGGENTFIAELGRTVFREANTNERYRHRVSGATITMPRRLARRLRFNRANARVDSLLFERIAGSGYLVYSTHSLGFGVNRHGDGHTWERAGGLLPDEFAVGVGLRGTRRRR